MHNSPITLSPLALITCGLAVAFGILASVAGRFAAILIGRRAVRRIGVAVAYDLRNRLYAHLERQGPGFFARYRTGDLMARAINDIGLVRQLVANAYRGVRVVERDRVHLDGARAGILNHTIDVARK